MNDDHANLESRLSRMQPADLPLELARRLRASEPPPRAARFSWPGALAWCRESWRRPWPLAYAGLAGVWALILTLRVLTPTTPEHAAGPASSAQAATIPADAPVFAATLLFARSHSDQP